MIESVPLLCSLAADLYLKMHSEPIRKQFPETKIWEYEWACKGKQFRIRMNGTGEENDGVQPWGMILFGNGWPVFLGDPGGGCVCLATEDELVDVLQNELDRLVAVSN